MPRTVRPPARRSRPEIVRVGAALVLGFAASTRAQTIVWDGGGDGSNWTVAANWNPNRLPTAGDDVLIPAGAGSVAVRSGSLVAHSLRCDRNFRVTGGRLTVSGEFIQGAASSLRVSGGELGWGSAVLHGSCDFAAGALVANGPTTFFVGPTLQGGAITGPGDITLAADAAWLWGDVSGTGRLIVAAGVVLETLPTTSVLRFSRPTEVAGGLRLGPYPGLTLLGAVDLTIAEGAQLDATAEEQYTSLLVDPASPDIGRLVLRGDLNARNAGGFQCEARLDAAPGSRIVGGSYPRVQRAAGVVESTAAHPVSLVGAPPIFASTTSLICPSNSTFLLSLDPGFPPGLLNQMRGNVWLTNESRTEAAELPSDLAPQSLHLTGSDLSVFRLSSDLTLPEFESWWPRVELLATLTITRSIPVANRVEGPGRIVIAAGATSSVCGAAGGVTVENFGTTTCPDGFGVLPGSTFINQPGARTEVERGGDFLQRVDRGVLINRGVLNFHTQPGHLQAFNAHVRNEEGGVVRCGPDDPSSAYLFPYVGGPQNGLWICDLANAVTLGAGVEPVPISFEEGCEIRGAGAFNLVGAEFTVLPGATVAPARLVVGLTLGGSPRTSLTLQAPITPGVLEVNGALVVGAPCTLPRTTISGSGSLEGPGAVTVSGDMTIRGRLDGPGVIVAPPDASLLINGLGGTQIIARPIENFGRMTLSGSVIQLTSAALTNRPGGIMYVRGQRTVVSSSDGGVLLNFGSVLFDEPFAAQFNAALDNRGVVISRDSRPFLASTSQRQGSALTGGEWRVGGSGGFTWPTGVVIDTIGPDARVVLEPGAALPSPAFSRTLRRIDGELRLEGGRSLPLQPDGAVANAGVVTLSGGSTLSVGGRYEQTGLLAVAFDPGSGLHGGVSAAAASLHGTLRIDVLGDPACGDAFEAVVAPDLQDHLTGVSGAALPPGRRWAARAEPGRLIAGAFADADFDADGLITADDYLDYLACFIGEGCPRSDAADFNHDGFLDIFDYDDFVQAFESGGC